MATEKLLKAVVTGPGDQLDHAIRALIIGHQFHPINATSSMKLLGKLKTPEGSNPYRGHLDTAVTLLSNAYALYGDDFAVLFNTPYLSGT